MLVGYMIKSGANIKPQEVSLLLENEGVLTLCNVTKHC